jgi:hypothetical protein
MLAKMLSRNGVGTCASGHSARPPGVSIHFVHWWSGSYAVEVGGGMAGCGVMHGGLVGEAVGWRMGGVGRAEGVSVCEWSLGALNAAAGWAFMGAAGGGSRLRRARAAFLSWVAMSRRRPMLTSCLTDSKNLEALQLERLVVGWELALASWTRSRMRFLAFFKRGSVPPRCSLGFAVFHKFFF